nr:LamG domain-containing protein [uncultured Bdellovibrio sp.]
MRTFVLLAFLFLTGCGILTSFIDSTESPSVPATPISLKAQNFVVVYNGEGHVDFNTSDITLSPKASTASTETHASLVLIKDTVDTPLQDFELTLDLSVTQQLRQNTAANDWEVFWLFFSYNDNGDVLNKTTNYFMSKPGSGSELGLAHGELGQKFISTDAAAKTALASRHVFKYVRVGGNFTVYRDGSLFYSFVGSAGFPQKIYSSKGSLGFYSEDAEVKIYSVALKRLNDSHNPGNSPILPSLSSASPRVTAPLFGSALNVTVNNSAQVGNLFWSCNFKKLIGDLTGVANQDCLSLGSLSDAGVLDWTPSFAQVGSWFLNFESSELYSGFSRQKVYLQVRPTWTSNQQLFLYDPQFSLSKNLESQNVLVARNSATSENNKTDPWPNLTNSDSVDLTGLSEATPWVTDTDTQLSALHFDANQDAQGLPLAVGNLGTTQDLRISYWFKRDNTDSKAALLANHSNGVLESRHWIGVISSRYTDGASEVSCDDPNAAPAGWTFVTTQVISGVLKTFVNGRQVCSQNLPATYNFSSPLRVGPKVQTFYPFAGRHSEIAGYKQSTSTEIFNDFTATADRYRAVKVGAISQSGLVLHWDAANAEQGLTPSSTAMPMGWFDLAPYVYSKTMGNFNGNASSGFITTTPASSSMKFDGTDDYIQLAADSHLSLGPTWTIEAWLKPGTALGFDTNYASNDVRYPLYKTVFEKANYDNSNKLSHGFGLRIGPTNTVDAFFVNNYGFTDTVQGLTALNATQWYHVAVSFDKTASQLKSYVNGVLESTKTVNFKQDSSGTAHSDGDVITGLSDAFLGIPFDVDGRRRFNGNLAILRVYQSTLTAAQVKAHCQAQKDRFSVTCN